MTAPDRLLELIAYAFRMPGVDSPHLAIFGVSHLLMRILSLAI